MKNRSFIIRKEGRVTLLEFAKALTGPDDIIDLIYGLSDFCREYRSDSDSRVLVLADTTSHVLSMGEDVIERITSMDDVVWRQARLMVDAIAELDRPVIAAIGSDAVGLGLEVILACDIRMGTPLSHFGFPEVRKRLLPRCGGTQRLPRIIGRGKAIEMLLTGEMIDSQEALATGLLSRVVPAEDLMTSALELAGTLAMKGSLAAGYIKEAVHKGMDLTLEQGLRLEADLYFLLHTTADRTEGIKAFQERRNPKFLGK